jgi:tRNA/rRNA methyltransferase
LDFYYTIIYSTRYSNKKKSFEKQLSMAADLFLDLCRVRIVLVEPRGAFNIGSVARVMKNMGLEDLALVNPVPFHNDDGYRGAVGARDVVNGAKLFTDLADAVAGSNLVVGTTRRAGKLRKITCGAEELPGRIFPLLGTGRVSILFGREESGLTTSEAALCNLLVSIAANTDFPSLNLSHAVALVCYELFTAAIETAAGAAGGAGTKGAGVSFVTRPASREEIEELLEYIRFSFEDMGFFSKGTPDYVIPLFRRLFGRALADQEEVKNLTHVFHRLYGLFREKKAATRSV